MEHEVIKITIRGPLSHDNLCLFFFSYKLYQNKKKIERVNKLDQNIEYDVLINTVLYSHYKQR